MHSKRDNGKFSHTADITANGNTYLANTEHNMGDSKRQVISVTLDKKMAPGWSLYGEFNHFRDNNTQAVVDFQDAYRTTNNDDFNQGVKDNHGHVVIVGTKVKF